MAKENDPYLPSTNEKKRNKEDKFVYDPEDTSYLNTPYREMGDGRERYEMGGVGKKKSVRGAFEKG